VDDVTRGATNKRYPGVKPYTLELGDGCGVYYTSPYMSGTHPLAWTNEEKTEGIQFKHEVVALDDEEGYLLIFDFCFSDKEMHDKFMRTHAKEVVHFG
jgi:hypothetical protein